MLIGWGRDADLNGGGLLIGWGRDVDLNGGGLLIGWRRDVDWVGGACDLIGEWIWVGVPDLSV